MVERLTSRLTFVHLICSVRCVRCPRAYIPYDLTKSIKNSQQKHETHRYRLAVRVLYDTCVVCVCAAIPTKLSTFHIIIIIFLLPINLVMCCDRKSGRCVWVRVFDTPASDSFVGFPFDNTHFSFFLSAFRFSRTATANRKCTMAKRSNPNRTTTNPCHNTIILLRTT